MPALGFATDARRRKALLDLRWRGQQTNLFGLVRFDVSGRFASGFDPAGAFFTFAVEQMAGFLGLAANPEGRQEPDARESIAYLIRGQQITGRGRGRRRTGSSAEASEPRPR